MDIYDVQNTAGPKPLPKTTPGPIGYRNGDNTETDYETEKVLGVLPPLTWLSKILGVRLLVLVGIICVLLLKILGT